MRSDDIIETETIPATQPTLQFDARAFLIHLEGLDLTDAQKMECIETIWRIVLQFIDLGFAVDPVSQARQSKTILSFNAGAAAPVLLGSIHPEHSGTDARRARNASLRADEIPAESAVIP
jgi:hypothetical protein